MDAIEGLIDAIASSAPAKKSKPKKPKTVKPPKAKPAVKKAAKPKAKKKAAKPAGKKKLVKKVAKKSKAKPSTVVRSERLDMRLSKGEKAKLVAKAKKLRRTVTSIVYEAIEKIK